MPGHGDYSPHGFCYLWDPKLMGLHVVSDILISLAYFTIPITLMILARRRRDMPFGWILGLFGTFIVACGLSHVLEVWNLWHTNYWLEGVVKAITAVASIATAILVASALPRLIALPGISQWAEANSVLEAEAKVRRESEERLRAQEAHLRGLAELVELTHDAIFVRDLDSKILFWNPAAERLYGWSKDEAIGAVSHELLHTKFPVSVSEVEAQVVQQGWWEGELTHTRRDGQVCVVSSRWALRRDANGEPVSMLESNRDISARLKEERKFRGLLESAPDPMVIVDGQGIIRLVNARAMNVFGYTREELVGQKVEIIVPERFHQRHVLQREQYSKCPAQRAMGEDIELYGRHKDGREFPVEVSLSPLETGEGVLISSAIRDVSDRVRIQAYLRDANQYLEQRVQSRTEELANANSELNIRQESMELAQRVAQIGTFELDGATGNIIRTSGLEAVYGLKEGTFPKTREGWRATIHHEDREHAKSVLDAAIASHSTYFDEWRIVHADGRVRWILAQGQLFYDDQGQFRRLVGANLDISDRKNKENEVNALNASLELRVDERTRELSFANKELESFSYSVSHDLRAPLRHIDGFATILSEEYGAGLPEEARSYLVRIIKSATDMGKLIDSLIKLAHLGRRELTRQQVNFGELVKAVIGDLPQAAASRDVEWRIEALPTANCDPDLLRVVLTNLLSNALKFTGRRDVAVIEVGTVAKNGELAYFVKDNGVGFDPRYADKLFGVFQRLHAQEKFEGTGIGLATVQRVIHRHGGRIWAESAPDGGATFFFTLEPTRNALERQETANDSLRNHEPETVPIAK
jgi:PAS domain S-box-containing protein